MRGSIVQKTNKFYAVIEDKAAAVMNSLLENRLEDDTETPQ